MFYKIKRFWTDQIHTRIFPRQSWLFKKIGRHWHDKDTLLEITIFESMIHFWENERGEQIVRYQFESIEFDPKEKEVYEENLKIYRELDSCYRWAKIREKLWDDLWDGPLTKSKWDEERNLIERDTFYMTEIIRLRKYMWT